MRFDERRGITVVEVLASLVLLATLLVSILQSHDRLARQTKLAQQRLAAIEAADELMRSWTATEPMTIPARTGQTVTQPSFHWVLETRIDSLL